MPSDADARDAHDPRREIDAFSAEFGDFVEELPYRRALKDVDRLLDVLDELVSRTVHLGSVQADPTQ